MTCARRTLMPCYLYSSYVKKTLLRNICKALWFLVSSLTRFWCFDCSLVPYSTPSCTLERGNFRLESPLVNHFLEKQNIVGEGRDKTCKEAVPHCWQVPYPWEQLIGQPGEAVLAANVKDSRPGHLQLCASSDP